MKRKIEWERIAAVLITVALGGVFLGALMRYVLPILLPFLLAAAVAALIRPVGRKCAEKTGVPPSVCAVALFLILQTLLLWGLIVSARALLRQLLGLINRLLSDSAALPEILASVGDFAERIGLPRDGETWARLSGALPELAGGFLSSVSTAATGLAASVISGFPLLFLSIVVILFAGCYFCIDGDRMWQSFRKRLPEPMRRPFAKLPATAGRTMRGYLRAYLILLLLTFVELLAGFSILGIEYAGIIALVTAVVDILPVLGVGTVLLPWAGVLLLRGDYRTGVGLLILYAVVLLVRQIAEPRLIGKSIGLHPLLTLFSSYAGFYLFGVGGMLAGPILAVLLRGVFLLFRREGTRT